VAYGVSGSFSIVRYTGDNAKNQATPGASKDGNSSNKMGIGDHLNPGALDETRTFNLRISQKYNVSDAQSEVGIFTVEDCRVTSKGGNLTKRGLLVESYAFVGVLAGDLTEDAAAIIDVAKGKF
jgi:hypothetical protein